MFEHFQAYRRAKVKEEGRSYKSYTVTITVLLRLLESEWQ